MTIMDGKHEMDDWKERKEEVPFWTSTRLCLAAIGFIGFLHIYAQRVGMSVAIVCMVNQTAVRMLRDGELGTATPTNTSLITVIPTNASITGEVLTLPLNNGSDVITADMDKCSDAYLKASGKSYEGCFTGTWGKDEDGPFVWDKSIQGHVLGAFFYGYLVSQIPAGMLAEAFSGKWVFFVFILITTIATILTPLAAQAHWILLVVLRVIAGIGSGACYPCMHAIWSKWAPPNERSKLTNLTYAGAWMGNVVALPLSGLLCRYGFANGWPSIFYIIGGSSLVWLVFWAIFVSDSPSESKRIRAVERDYIVHSLKGQLASPDSKRKERPPWGKIVCSGPVWAILIAGISSDWGLYTFLTNIPTYMSEVLKFDVQSNGFFSALPFLGLYVNMNISPFVADKLISSEVMSRTNVRRLMQCIGSFGAAIFLVGLGFLDCTQPMLAVTLLVLGVTFSASVYSGYLTNPMDIAPRYAGTVLGIANGLAASTGFAAPYTVAALTPNQSQGEWQRVFFISAAIYVGCTILYCLLCKAELQPWAAGSDEEDEDSNKQEMEVLRADQPC